MSHSLKAPALASLAGSLVLAGSAFASTPLPQGYMLSTADATPRSAARAAAAPRSDGGAKAGEMKCGAGKAGEMECGAKAPEKAKPRPAPTGRKAAPKMAEGKCGEGKCGGSA